MHSAFIDKFQVLDQGTEFLRPSCGEFASQTIDAQRFSFAIVERLFFAAHHAGTRLHLLEVEPAFTQFRQRKIGLVLDLARMNLSQSLSIRFGPWTWECAATAPLTRFQCNYFSTVDKPTPKEAATAVCVASPASAARITRSRRSVQYGSMLASLTRSNRKATWNSL